MCRLSTRLHPHVCNVEVLEGRVRGRQKTPIEGLVEMPGEVYPSGDPTVSPAEEAEAEAAAAAAAAAAAGTTSPTEASPEPLKPPPLPARPVE